MKIHSFLAPLIAVALPVTALAVSVDVNGINVQVNTSGGTTQVQTNVGGVQNNIGVTTSGTGTNAAANVNVNGTVVNLQRSGSSLDVLVSGGSLTGTDKSVLVNLSGGSDVLIKTDADLAAYSSIVVQERPGVVSVSTDDNALRVGYRQPGKFLGIFRTKINGTVIVDDSGKVTVSLPWYSFLFKKDDSVAANVALSIQNAGASVQVGVLGSSDGKSITVRNKAKLINVVTSSVNTSVSVTQ